jgi:hypothetical protein
VHWDWIMLACLYQSSSNRDGALSAARRALATAQGELDPSNFSLAETLRGSREVLSRLAALNSDSSATDESHPRKS